MEIVGYDKDSNTSDVMSLADFARSMLVNLYQRKNPDASEDNIAKTRDEIEIFISETKQWFEKIMLPIKATIKLAEQQYVSLGYLDEKLAEEIMRTDSIDVLLNEKIEIRKHIDIAIDELRQDDRMKPYDTLFQQAITAYKSELCDLAVLGFFAIIDGVLSDITKDRDSVKIKKRIVKAVNFNDTYLSEDDIDIDVAIQKVSLFMVSELLAESKPFSGIEPQTLNRHWAMHGRTRAKKTKIDCEKLVLFIWCLMSLTDDSIEESN